MAKNLILWLVIAAVLLAIFQNLSGQSAGREMNYSEFLRAVQSNQISEVTISGYEIYGKQSDGQPFETVRPDAYDEKLIDYLYDNNVEIVGKKPEQQSILTQLFIAVFPILVIIAVFFFFMRHMQGGGGGGKGPMSFGKSKARLLSEDQIKTTFADVAGVDEAKEEVGELVDFLKDPGKYHRLGGKIPRGVLMQGPPGTGKTLLAKAIAGEAKVPFFTISGSDFVEMFVGVGASRVRDMFDQAKKQAPCIVFIDEIDAVGRHRGAGVGGGNDEREQTLNQLLVEMDGFEANDGVIVIAATNRSDVLDSALTRPGRFDRQVTVGLPDIKGREQILKVHLRKVPVDDDVNPKSLARSTSGFSGADLANLINEGALLAARSNKKLVTMNMLERAKDKIIMGVERKSMVMSEHEKEVTAYHEAGHAIVGHLMPDYHPIYKVTIIPRANALGVTVSAPEEDKHNYSMQYYLGMVAMCYGGRVAEGLIYGQDQISSGASGDIQQASRVVRAMVKQLGYSKLGPILFESDRARGEEVQISPHIAKDIDDEVYRIVDEQYKLAEKILTENRDKLEVMKDALLEYETIDHEQVVDIMEGRKPKPPKGWDDDNNNTQKPAAQAELESDDQDEDELPPKPNNDPFDPN